MQISGMLLILGKVQSSWGMCIAERLRLLLARISCGTMSLMSTAVSAGVSAPVALFMAANMQFDTRGPQHHFDSQTNTVACKPGCLGGREMAVFSAADR